VIGESAELSEQHAGGLLEGEKVPRDRDGRRQIVVDILATAIIDILLKKARACPRET
jgi:hypothetical protein